MTKNKENPIGMVYGKTTINTIQAVKFSDSTNIQIGMLVKFSTFGNKEILGRIYSIWTKNRLLESEDSLPNLSVKDFENNLTIENIGFSKELAQIVAFNIIIIGYFDENTFLTFTHYNFIFNFRSNN